MRLGLGCAVASLFLFLSGCSTQLAEPTGCTADAGCGAGAFCRDGACAASRAPQARVSEPAGPRLSHSRLRFDAGGSSDPDPGDHVVAYAWRARATEAPCEPVHVSGTDQAFELLSACAGRFEVALKVRDSAGVESAEAAVQVELFPHPTPPSVSLPAGPILLDHRCAGTPLRCTAVDPSGAESFALQATATSPMPGPFSWRWSVEVPAALATAPRVALSAPDAADPTCSISTEGTPIAGTYRITVEATDPLGVVAAAQVEITVGNRPPEAQATGSALSVPHAFLDSPPRFVAEGGVPAVEVVDPDGDPVTTSYAAEEMGVASPGMTVAPVGAAAGFTIVVPGGDPASLVGPGVARAVRLRADDGNGGSAEVTWTVEVQNRPPRRAGPFAAAASHTFDLAAARYRSTFALADYVDDDGDPLSPSASVADAACPSLAFAGGQLRAQCEVAYLGTPAVGGVAGIRSFLVVVADPWAQLAGESAAVTIGNGGPALSAPDVAVRCTRGACCDYDVETATCHGYSWTCPLAEGTVSVAVSDPDGDPVALNHGGATPGTEVCLGGTCAMPLAYSVPASSTCSLTFAPASMQASASDGLLSATLAIPLRK